MFRSTERLFLRLLGIIYLIAFGSLWPQIVGLVGAKGIAPAHETLTAMHADYGWRAYLDVPSLFWLSPTDGMLRSLCVLGCGAALLLILGRAVRFATIAGYVFYLSLVTVGQPFTSFQWDALLLETGFLAIFAGSSLLPIAYRFLLFRLMFESGIVKLTSGDVNWRNLQALRFHFLTQPLPNPAAYYFYFAPHWLLDVFTLATLLTELIVPFFLFAYSRRVRQTTFALLVSLQLFIALTGNFAFFNLLTIALCIWALDDSCLRWLTQVNLPGQFPALEKRDVALGLVMALSILQIFGLTPFFIDSFEIVNPYGLFAVMTTSRTELIFEGSDDNINWQEYSFLYKPGDVHRGLPMVAPYQPRLDWQLWFAALSQPESNIWVKTLVYRLLMGQREVLDLLGPSAFRRPPREIRVQSYIYTFCVPSSRKGRGGVWERKLLGTWFGPVSIDSPK